MLAKVIRIPKLLFQSVSERGLKSTASRIYLHIARWITDTGFDRKYGTDTADVIELKDLQIEGTDINRATWYEPISHKMYYAIMNYISIQHDQYIFVDIGSGKGKVLLLASKFPFVKIIGVEFAQQLNSIAQQNIRNYSDAEQQCYDMETKCIDAVKYDLPEENLVLFFYSPFSDAQIMRRILDNITLSLENHSRHIIIIFHGENKQVINAINQIGFYRQELKVCRDISRAHHYRTIVYSNLELGIPRPL